MLPWWAKDNGIFEMSNNSARDKGMSLPSLWLHFSLYTQTLAFHLPRYSPECHFSFLQLRSDDWQSLTTVNLCGSPKRERRGRVARHGDFLSCAAWTTGSLSPSDFFLTWASWHPNSDIPGPTTMPKTRGLTLVLNPKWGHMLVVQISPIKSNMSSGTKYIIIFWYFWLINDANWMIIYHW